MTKLKLFKYYIETFVFYFLSAILLIILSLVIWQVISRYFLSNPSVFTEELVRFLLLWLGSLAAVYTFGQHKHIALTFLVYKSSLKTQYMLMIIHHVIILLVAILFFIYGGVQLMNITKIQTSAVLMIPMPYIFAIFPFCGIVLFVYEIIDIISLMKIKE